MATSTKPKRMNPVVAALILVAVLVFPLSMILFGRQIDDSMPSWFLSRLTDHSYLGWHRWWPVTAGEALFAAFAVWIPILFAYYQIDAIYHLFHNNKAAARLGVTAAVAAVLALFVYAPLAGGYAIYADRLAVLDPFRELSARTVTPGDIDHIEIGCHSRIGLRGHRHMPVPSYRIVLRDSRVVSLFDLADVRYDDNRLMRAVLAFDAQVQARHLPKRMRTNIFGTEMSNNGYCYGQMEGKYDPALVPAIRRTFEGG